MKESISYSFLLNIVLLFIFVCFAIVMGTLSYYKAYKANKIISETIEKYEGYNCISETEIARKLVEIGYITPFTVNCKGSDGNCLTDAAQTYKVVSYNLDKGMNNAQIAFSQKSDSKYVNMNSSYKCDDTDGCVTNKNYQYGIYTYMYVDLPVVSSLIKISLFTKTSIMYEFRDFYVEVDADDGDVHYIDTSSTFDLLYNKKYADGKIYIKDAVKLEKSNPTSDITKSKIASYIFENSKRNIKNSRDLLGYVFMDIYSDASTGNIEGYAFRNYIYAVSSRNSESLSNRDRLMYEGYKGIYSADKIDSKTASFVLGSYNQVHACGYTPNYGVLGGIK